MISGKILTNSSSPNVLGFKDMLIEPVIGNLSHNLYFVSHGFLYFKSRKIREAPEVPVGNS